MNRRYEGYGMNWVHYLEGDFNDEAKTVVVQKEYRIHKNEGPFPEALPGREFVTRIKDGVREVGIQWIENYQRMTNWYRVEE